MPLGDRNAARSKRPACPRRRGAPLIGFAIVLFVLGLSSAASAGPFSQLFVFGDSLSDVGNVAQGTDEWYPLAPRTPGQYYYNGRFSNGPVYVEALATGLGLPTLTHSRSDGNNYAHGGAKTTGTTGLPSLLIRDIDDQVTDYLADTTGSDPNALYVVFAGANDLIDGQTNMNTPVNRLGTDIGRLINDGARKFLVFNLPLLGHTPRFNSNPTNLATYNSRSQQFNNTLSLKLNDLQTANPSITLFRFDTAGLFSEALVNPSAFGLTNVTASAAPGLEPGDASYNTSQIVAHPHEYLFWDDLHPTAAVHAIIAQRALALVSPTADFNVDGTIDAADYVMSRAGLTSTDTASSYAMWQAQFGEPPGGGGSAQNVPEPATMMMVAATAIIFLGRTTAQRRHD